MPRVLVVDDLRSEAFRVTALLKAAGYECLTAQNGAEAFEIAKAQMPDLILMDIVMGEEDGFKACRRLKKDPATQAIPVIFATSKSDENAQWWAERIGAADFLRKPVPAEKLIQAVKRFV